MPRPIRPMRLKDQNGSFEPELVKKGQTRIAGMDDKFIHGPAGACEAICREGASMPLVCWSVTSVRSLSRSMT